MVDHLNIQDDTGLREACGVFGCVLAQTIYLGLVGLQHRGQESAGIVTSKGSRDCRYNVRKGMGLVSNVFSEDDPLLHSLTHGDSDTINVQPFVVETIHGLIAMAHNGELVNAKN
jgi:amidophosphoribosyltransferase